MVKKLMLVLGMLLIASPGVASEVKKGSIELNGDIAFQYNSLSEDVGSYFDIQARAGFLRAVSDLVQLGAGTRFTFFNGDLGPVQNSDGGVISAEGLLRLNFGDSPQVIPFLQLAIGVGSWYGDFYADSEVSISPSASAGIRYPFRDAAALTMIFTYIREINYLGIDGIDSNTFLFGFGFSIFPRGLGG
jgi:hypothetical protein